MYPNVACLYLDYRMQPINFASWQIEQVLKETKGRSEQMPSCIRLGKVATGTDTISQGFALQWLDPCHISWQGRRPGHRPPAAVA